MSTQASDPTDPSANGKSAETPVSKWVNLAVAIAVGMVGAVFVWVLAPVSDMLIGNLTWVGSSPVSDTYLPPIVLFVVFILVLVVNPLLRRFMRPLALSKAQLALAVGMMLVACVLPGQGLLKALPYIAAETPRDVSQTKQIADIYSELKLPRALFPDKLGYRVDTPVSDAFVEILPLVDNRAPKGPREPIPWSAWIAPLWSWGLFLLPYWLMMIGLALIVLPQWRDSERLTFPLINLQEALIEEPEEGKYLASIFRQPSFWVAAAIVLGLHLLSGYNQYYPDRVPAIPLKWDLSGLFTDGWMRYLPYYIKQNQIFFIFVGLAYFMPSRIGFSIWFFELLYAVYTALGHAYFPPFYPEVATYHRQGATWAIAAAVVFFGRKHWLHVMRCTFTVPRNDAERRDGRAGILFLVGIAGMFAWMIWTGIHPLWALFFILFAFVIMLVTTRIVAETGMAFVRLHFNYYVTLVHLAPVKWLNFQTIYFGRIMSYLFAEASRVCGMTMALHAIGLDRSASPRRQWRTSMVVLGVLIVGLLAAGSVHLYINYNNSATINGKQSPINGDWGLQLSSSANWDLTTFSDSKSTITREFNQWAHLGFGAGVAAALQTACLMSPKFPLHPIGMLLVYSFYFDAVWVSIFIGWLAKVLAVRYGGARLYRAARSAFVGLIVGEVFAAMFWVGEPAVRAWFGMTYKILQMQP